MSAELLINVRPNQTRVAYVEQGVLADLKVEKVKDPTLVGSIYKGKVRRVLPGMQAAFVDIGLARAAFLYVGDVRGDISGTNPTHLFVDEGEEEGERDELLEDHEFETINEETHTNIQDLLTEGQMILVQVAKDPLGTKGARITTHISLPGRNVVYTPLSDHIGISRRIEDEEERGRLKKLVEKVNHEGGVIVRTAGEGVDEESLKSDLDFLNRIWKDVQKSYEKRKTPGLIYADLDVELRAVRDLLHTEVDRIIVDDSAVGKKINSFLSQFMPRFKNKVEIYKEQTPIFDLYDIDLEISRSLGRKIWLKSGGYIVVDEAEALVVIDVNTGRFVGKKDLEDTILKTNLEAVKEIAHQLRIRNCGGIIIVDFIDMEKEIHREKVLTHLEQELRSDRARTTVVSMSELGLVEMTRKRTRPSLVATLCDPCPYCEGRGYIKQNQTITNEIFRALEREVERGSKGQQIVVHCHAEIADWIYEQESEGLDFIENRLQRSVAFKIEPNFHKEQHEISTQ